MRLPFLHTTAAALYVSQGELVWASGTRLGSRLRTWRMEAEPVAGDDVRAALGRLVERVRPVHPYVVTHLDASHVRHALLQGPPFDDEVGFDAWLEAEAARQLPARVRLDDFVMGVQVLERSEAATRCLLALASRRAVEERVSLLEDAGLQVLAVGSADAACGDALEGDPAFARRASAVLLCRPAGAVLLRYQDGLLQSLEERLFADGVVDAGALLAPGAHHGEALPDRLYVGGTTAASVAEAVRSSGGLGGVAVQIATLAPGPGIEVPAEQLPAAALLLQELASVPDALNFIEPEAAARRRQDLEKREGVLAIGILGALVGMAYGLVLLGSFLLDGRLAASEAAPGDLAGAAARHEDSREAVRRLEHRVRQAAGLVVGRTHVASALETLGRATPEGLWLDAVYLKGASSPFADVTLAGAAFGEDELAAYLDHLERIPLAADVRLRFAEAVPAGTRYRQARAQRRLLVAFEIRMSLRTWASGGEDLE